MEIECSHSMISSYSPSIANYFKLKDLSHNFVRVKIQNQVLAVHVSVSSASSFARTKEVKQGSISGLTD